MTLDATEFVRRFLLHVLPAGFMRIRYYGFLANRHRSAELDHCRRLLDVANQEKDPAPGDWAALMEALTGEDPLACPRCSGGRMQVVSTLPRSRVPYPPIPNLANRIDSS